MNQNQTPLTAHDALARRLAAGLNTPLPHDISERLRAARVRAVSARRVISVQVQADGTLTLDAAHDRLRPLGWLASVLPLIALIVGLVTIKQFQDERRAREVADIDTALLTDDLPPSAYTDPGFLRFLKMPLGATSDGGSGAKPE
jgi:hypothetical protein